MVLISLKACNGLKGCTQLDAEGFGTVEHVSVLIGQRSRRTQVACGVGAFGLEHHTVFLVRAQRDVAVERVGAGHFGKPDVGVFHHLQSAEFVVGFLQVGRVEIIVWLNQGVFAQHRHAQRDVIFIACGMIIHATDLVAHMWRLYGIAVACRPERMQHHGEVNLGAALHGVGIKGDEVFVKIVVALFVEQGGDALALVVEVGNGKRLALFEQCVSRAAHAQHFSHALVLYVMVHRSHRIPFAWMQVVSDGEFFSFAHHGFIVNGGAQIAHVDHHLVEVLAGALSEQGVEEHGLLAHLAQLAVDPFGAVVACHGIGCKRHLDQREPFGVRPLAHIGLKLGCSKFLAVGGEFHLVQQIMVLRHQFLCRTAHQSKSHNHGHRPCRYLFYDCICH